MRFSLATLLLLVLWMGALIGIWARREPWVIFQSRQVPSASLKADSFPESPDKTRAGSFDHDFPNRFSILDTTDMNLNEVCHVRGPLDFGILVPHRFVDDNTLEAVSLSMTDEKVATVVTFHRRFPEWWWGHFYRPEVWLSIALSILLGWRAMNSRRGAKA